MDDKAETEKALKSKKTPKPTEQSSVKYEEYKEDFAEDDEKNEEEVLYKKEDKKSSSKKKKAGKTTKNAHKK